MKVSDIMQTQVDFVETDIPLRGVARLIFGRGINGVPVCKGKKVVGFVTERDILSKFYPSMQDYIEDPVHSADFEGMEKKLDEILDLPVSKIMSHTPTTITADTPLLKAQSTMMVKKIGRLPVVDDKGGLIGLLSKSDIFRAVVGDKLPFEQDEKFHDWVSRRYDTLMDWKARLEKEIPDLVGLFKKENAKTILEIGSSTGEHGIALAKEGFHVVGVDRSARMIYESSQKIKTLSDTVRQRVNFVHTEYKNLNQVLSGVGFDAAIFMGGALTHILDPLQALKEVNKVMNKKAVIVCQMPNYEKILKSYKRLYDFAVRKSPYPEEREQLFLRFYDPKEEGFLTLNICVFSRGKKKWVFKGMNSLPIVQHDKESTTSLFKKISFSNLSYYGGEKGFFYDYLFRKPFKPTQSDVLVVVAKR
ncbi:MAG: CBS domain-containing protein [Patescibacteria group bacterium]